MFTTSTSVKSWCWKILCGETEGELGICIRGPRAFVKLVREIVLRLEPFRWLTTPYADELLTKLPEGVTVKLRLPRASPGPSLQHRINWQPVLEAGSTTNSGREPSVLHGSISADSAILEPSASIPGVDATSSSIGSLSAIIGIPSPYQGQLVDFSATTEAHDILQDIDFSMMHEIGRGAEFDFVNTSVADYCAREFPLFNFPLNLQPHGAFTSAEPRNISKALLLCRFSQLCFSYLHS